MNTNNQTQQRASERQKFHTQSAVLIGAFCGSIWMPAVKATLPVTEDMRSRFERFSTSDVSFRDALLSLQNEKGGDFQNPSFTADTVLIIKRVKFISPGHTETRVREIEVQNLKDCADLVDTETYSYDFDTEE